MVIDYDVTNAELDVLQLLWQHGPMTVRQLADVLYPGGKAAQYATVQTLLGRLEAKECVRGDRALRPHQFRAAVGREALIGWRLRQTAEKLCGGSMTPLLLHLLDTEAVSDDARIELRAFVEQLRKSSSDSDASDPGP
jgi:predicted transcriptional regulator